MNKEAVRTELLAIYDAIARLDDEAVCRGPKEPMDAAFKRIYALADTELPDQDVDALLADATLAPALAAIDRLRNLYGPRLERERAYALLQADDPWEYIRGFLFYPNYVALAEMERRGAGLLPGQRVLFLGSGPLPLSLIMLCSGNNAQLGLGMEQKEELIELSQQIIRRLGLDKSIQIRHGNHFDLPPDPPADLYLVASAAEPKQEIFAHLAAALPSGARVSFRTHEKAVRRLINAATLHEAPAGFKELARIQPEPPVINTCVFLEKE